MKTIFTEEQCLEAMYALFKDSFYSDLPLSQNQYEEGRKTNRSNFPSAKTIINRFGSWHDANILLKRYARDEKSEEIEWSKEMSI